MTNNIIDGLKMKKTALLLLIALTWIPSLVWSDDVFIDTESERLKSFQELEDNWPEWLEEHLKTVAPLTIEGRVLDQNNDPIQGAEVKMQWDHFTSEKFYKTIVETGFAITDSDGFFSYTVEHAIDLSMYHPSKKGYEYQSGLGGDYYQARGSVQEAMEKNSVNEPIIIYMRKLNPTTFLLKSRVSYRFTESTTILRYTLNQGLLRKIDPDLSKLKDPEQNDLIFTVNKNGDDSYTIHIQPIPEIGGSMQVIDDYLYEAPAEGYRPDVSLTISLGDGEVRKYLYFTSRKSGVYSRMTMVTRVKDNGELAFGSTTWTNPYGKRNLEWEPDLPNKLRHVLRKEAEKALRDGKLATEPENLAQLMEQYTSE